MADITQTAANVKIGSHTSFSAVTAGSAVVPGDQVYSDSTDSGKYKPCTTASEAAATAVGMALTAASTDENFCLMFYQNGETFDPGGTVTAGTTYGVSDNAGKFAPESDWGTGDYMSITGTGTTASLIKVGLNVTGATHP